MKVVINGNDLTLGTIFEHVEKNQFNGSAQFETDFPDVSFMENLRWIDSLEVLDDEEQPLPIVCEYNYVESFTTSFTPTSKGYSLVLGYRERIDESDIT